MPTLAVTCSQGRLFTECERLLWLKGVLDDPENRPYLLSIPSGAEVHSRVESALRFFADKQVPLGRVVATLRPSRIDALAEIHALAKIYHPEAKVDIFTDIPELAPMRHIVRKVTVRCMDSRLWDVCLADRKRHDLREGEFDMLAYPGGAGSHTSLDADMRWYVDLGLTIETAIIKTHEHCAAGKDHTDLAKARKIIRDYFPQCTIIAEHSRRLPSGQWVSDPIALAA